MTRHLLLRIVLAFAAASTAAVPTVAVESARALTGTLVVTNKRPSTATIIDVATGRTLATLPTGAGPHEVALTSDGRTAVISTSGGNGRTLTVIDVAKRAVAGTIDLGDYFGPHGLAILPGDRHAAVTAEASQRVLLVDIEKRVVRWAIPTDATGSHMIGVTQDGTRGFTVNTSAGSVSELDLARGAFVRTFQVPGRPEAITVTPDGREVWVGSHATGRVCVLDPSTGAVATAMEGTRWPYRILFTPDTRTVVVLDPTADEVRFVDRATRRELSRLPLPGAGPQGGAITPDGRYLFISLGKQARVAIIELNTNAILGYLAAGETPDAVAYTTRIGL